MADAKPVGNDKMLVGMMIWAMLGTAGLLFLFVLCWDQAPGITKDGDVQERMGLALILVLGCLGGFLRWMHLLRDDAWLEERQKKMALWLVQSVLMPTKGGLLALFTTLVLRVGAVNSADATHVNWIALYSIAGLAGLFSPEAVTRLEIVFKSMFGVAEDGDKAKPAK